MRTKTLPHFNGQGLHRYEGGACVYCGERETTNDVISDYAELYEIALTKMDDKNQAKRMVESFYRGKMQREAITKATP